MRYGTMKKRITHYTAAAVLLCASVTMGPVVGRAAAADCASPLGDQATNAATVDAAYKTWKSKYVTASGAGGDLRVQRSAGDGYDTVSEGIAYGMLFAVYSNDKPTFDGLWAYAKRHMNANGVMNWRIAADGSTLGYNGATDADEDMAAALVAADSTWGGYTTSAKKQISTIKQYEIEQGTYIVKPGDVWGGSGVTNPSYMAPSYYDVFQAYTGDNDWAKVKAANYKVLQAAQNTATGLVPDWSAGSGSAVGGMSYNYSYDASRAPLRLALAAAWSCDAAAAELLKPLNAWHVNKNLSQLASSYSLTGAANGNGDSVPLTAAAASAATASDNAQYRTTAWGALKNSPSSSYYPDSMRLFGLLVASGTMHSPLTVMQLQPTTSVSAAYTITGSDTILTQGTAGEVTVGVSAPREQSGLIVDVELYDKDGRKAAQQVYENQTLGEVAKTYTLPWTSSAAGDYTVKAGVFTAGWVQNMTWNDKVATVTVKQAEAATPAPAPTPVPLALGTSVSIWWPSGGQPISGVQPFKAVLSGKNLADYDMYWQVDGGRLNAMDSVYDAAPHKESWVDLRGWSWSADGRYTITFVAKNKSGATLAQKSTIITVTP